MTQNLQDLERDIEQSRAKLDLTIDRLQGKMSVSGVVDDMLGTARSGRYAPLFDDVLETIRQNPIPVMLLAAGIGLLAYNLGRKPRVRHATTPVLIDPDIAAEPTDMRTYGPGASSLHAPPEDLLEPQRSTNSSIQRM